jgi:hypothetical protein
LQNKTVDSWQPYGLPSAAIMLLFRQSSPIKQHGDASNTQFIFLDPLLDQLITHLAHELPALPAKVRLCDQQPRQLTV